MKDLAILDDIETAFKNDPLLMPELPREQIGKALQELRWAFLMDGMSQENPVFTNRDVLLLRVLVQAARIDTSKYPQPKKAS